MKYPLALIALAVSSQVAAYQLPPLQQHNVKQEAKRYLIKYKRDLRATLSPMLSATHQIQQLNGATKQILHKQNTIAAELSKAALAELREDPNIEFIEEDPIREFAGFGQPTYGVEMTQAPLLASAASSNQKVCIIDTGYDSDHEDLPSGANITGEVLNTLTVNRDIGVWNEDTYGHGTHIMGTIAALNNGIGYQGIVPTGALNIHHVKIVDHPGYWRMFGSDVVAAVNACKNAGATVVNMSIAGWDMSEVEETALQDAYDDGLLLVAAGGNYGDTSYAYPASYKSVVSVGGIDKNRDKWMFTQENDQIELVAAGVEVASTLPNDRYGKWDGTSVAAPHVTGVAALVWGHFPDCSPYQIREALVESALDIGPAGRDNTYGYGIVQAQAAYDWLTANTCSSSNTLPEQQFDNLQEFVDTTQATLAEDFETWLPTNAYHSAKTVNDISWSSTVNLYTTDFKNGATLGPVDSNMLMSVGPELMDMAFETPVTGVGFNYLANGLTPNVISVTFTDGTSKVFNAGGTPTSLHFWGYVSEKEIASVRFANQLGGIYNTMIDNVYTR